MEDSSTSVTLFADFDSGNMARYERATKPLNQINTNDPSANNNSISQSNNSNKLNETGLNRLTQNYLSLVNYLKFDMFKDIHLFNIIFALSKILSY